MKISSMVRDKGNRQIRNSGYEHWRPEVQRNSKKPRENTGLKKKETHFRAPIRGART